MDFFSQQDRSKKHTHLLLFLFCLAVVATIIFTYLIFGTMVLGFTKPFAPNPKYPRGALGILMLRKGELQLSDLLYWLWEPKLFAIFCAGSLLSIAGGCFYKFRMLAGGGSAVAKLLGGRPLLRQSDDLAVMTLHHVVEEMAIAAQMPVPEIYVLEQERGLNTFAAGFRRDDVAIGVTYGCLKLLKREEMQAVIAHEFSHILNGDTRLNMQLIGVLHGLLWPVIIAKVLWQLNRLSTEGTLETIDRNPMAVLILVLFLPFLLAGCAGIFFVRLIKNLICRERELLADASAVQFTRSHEGLAGALKKVGGLLKQGRIDTLHAETASHLYFVSYRFDRWYHFFPTHPPLVKRIQAIDPDFDGKFPHILSVPSCDAIYDCIYENTLLRERQKLQAQRLKKP